MLSKNLNKIINWVNNYENFEEVDDEKLEIILRDSGQINKKNNLQSFGEENNYDDTELKNIGIERPVLFNFVSKCETDPKNFNSGLKGDWFSKTIISNPCINSWVLGTRIGVDYLCGCRLIVDKGEDLNKLLTSTFLSINKLSIKDLAKTKITTELSKSSILSLFTLYKLFYPDKKIEEREDKIIIPLMLFEFMEYGNYDMCSRYNEQIKLHLHKSDTDYDIILEVAGGYYENEIRKIVSQPNCEYLSYYISSNIFLKSTFNSNHYIDKYSINIVYHTEFNPLFHILWFVQNRHIITEEITNEVTEQITPSILNCYLEIVIDGVVYEKQIAISQIKRVKTFDYIGYLIPTNTISFEKLRKKVLGFNCYSLYNDIVEFNDFEDEDKLSCKLYIKCFNYNNNTRYFFETLSLDFF